MSPLSSRLNLVPQTPFRKTRPTTSKIIFISCEGAVTEEEYFNIASEIFSAVKSKIQFISVMEDAVNTPSKYRTREQVNEITRCQPKQLVEKINIFKQEKQLDFDFANHPEDEFWIITDIDNHTDANNIDDWESALAECDEKGYGYAISNPFFEIWLLLHHLDVNDDDHKFAVTETHPYERTGHFRDRLRNDAKAPLKDKKHISFIHYNEEKVKQAIKRAKGLHRDKEKRWPHNLGTTVYLLLEKIVELNV